MLLSSSIIVARLTGRFMFDILGKMDDSMVLSRPLFLTDDPQLSERAIYVGVFRKNDEVPSIPTHSLLITKGRILESVKDRFDCILVFDENADLGLISNYIHSIYNLYDSWHKDIMELALSGASLTEFLDRSQVIFTNPLKIHDKDFCFIAHSSIIETNPNLHFLLEDSTPQKVLADYLLDADYNQTFSNRKAEIFPAHLTGHRTAYHNIYSQNQFLCRILIVETIRTLQNSDLFLLEILSAQIEHVLNQENTLETPSLLALNRVLIQLISGEKIDSYTVQKTLTSFNWLPQNEYFCIKLIVPRLDVQNHALHALMEELENRLPGSCVLEYQNEIITIINLNQSVLSSEKIIDSLKEFIRDRNMRIGVSQTYHGASDIFQLLFRQADIALDVGLRYSPYKWIHFYHDNLRSYLLECCTRDLPAQMVVCPEILKIYEYDQEHHTEYMHTLKTYLDNNMQPGATSQKLFIHRTTFLYRIERLIEKFHLQLDDPKSRLMYHMSILILEQG